MSARAAPGCATRTAAKASGKSLKTFMIGSFKVNGFGRIAPLIK
jgi:hypothetical protein